MCETYNGWVNRETWCMSLWLESDQGTYDRLNENISALSEPETYEVANLIKDFFEEMEDLAPDFHRQIRDDVGSLYRVDWDEIAGHWVEE